MALSPFLFAIMMDCLTGNIQRKAPQDMLFVDNVIQCSEAKKEVKEKLGDVESSNEGQ